ncbi:hypothetical protein HKD37_03G006506 [Glycine soja]
MASRNLDEALVRLDNTMHSMTLNMDKLLNRLAPVPSSTTPNPTLVPRHSTSVPAQIRYAPSPYEDPVGALFKLTHTGSVLTYLKEFEDLANRIIGLPTPFLLPCFISGLTSEMRRTVQAPTVRHLTPEELASRHEHGLCFTCDEKFHRGHRCASRVHLLIAEDEEPID